MDSSWCCSTLQQVAQQQKRKKQVRLGLLSSNAHRLNMQHITVGAVEAAVADSKAGAANALISGYFKYNIT
jgi:hypothetical protein